MANEVYANGMELACKSGAGKTICAFPDVCFTPPENPATPPGVPVPYPNTGMASDTAEGSKTVKISGEEVMLKNQSYFKKSTGDEAGCAAKKGVISSKNTGKVYFIKWSMDVKFEGENVDRHLDMTTNNHGSPPNEAIPWPFVDNMAIDASGNTDDPCAKDKQKEKDKCEEFEKNNQDPCVEAGLGGTSRPRSHSTAAPMIQQRIKSKANDCINARRCRLQPYSKTKKDGGGCCPSQTGNHVIPASYFDGITGYNHNDAPTMCVEGTSWHSGNHGYLHTAQSILDDFYKDSSGQLSIQQAAKNGGQAQKEIFKEQSCDEKCIKAQVIDGHKKMGLNEETKVTHKSIAEQEDYVARLEDVLTGNIIP
ncbi:PAAR-like domain-containing protein [Crenothrix polyspora]|uniref:Tox-GHH2 domain-containing protein n=1 Tax=Crenothrix polyspora TaxID=360316 RepID=A0A1R4HAP7_9GAMM|nr:PAAR-like domain-containing protein [Crenothrix polyspora]SJM93101.1 conserved hypothetical protein [Crenothrix polyspora]